MLLIIPSLHEIAPWNGFITQMSIAPEFEISSVKRRLRVRPLNRMVTPTDPSFMVTGSSIPRPAFRPSMTAVRACCLNMAVFMSEATLTAKRLCLFISQRFSIWLGSKGRCYRVVDCGAEVASCFLGCHRSVSKKTKKAGWVTPKGTRPAGYVPKQASKKGACPCCDCGSYC